MATQPNPLEFQPQITSLLNNVQMENPRLYDLLHAMIHESGGLSQIVNKITGGAGTSFSPKVFESYFSVLKKVSLRL
jgi:hypothetical protein